MIIATSLVVPKNGFMPLRIRLEHRGELGAAVVDHLARAGLADGRRQGGRAGDAKVGLEAVHGGLLVGRVRACGGWSHG